MTKSDLVSIVSDITTNTKKNTEETVNILFKVISNTLNDGEKVKISGFGTFEMKTRKARNRVNPLTKEKVFVPEHKAISFKPSKNLE